ncbi:MAG: hypothetical protein FJZ15_02735 [Candidatus Omnitrophica bacterium]|nr:hypothetical protein [Candidatus Omnitrophota bacterium]
MGTNLLKKLSFCFVFCLFAAYCLLPTARSQQGDDLLFSLDVNSNTINTPNIFKPNIDLSGRGISSDPAWPQELSSHEALEAWHKDIGFSGMYRLQYNLWAIQQFANEKEKQDKLLANYEDIIKKISDSGGTVILDIYGMPAGMGKILDKKSPFFNFSDFKALVKSHIKSLSCEKRYNIWYEVWNAPDLDDFFLGRRQEYLNMYRAVAESIKELETEYRINIPVGAPSVSWWFQNLDGNTIITPERSLIYELIQFCYGYRLPLDFISWHSYSSDPKIDKEVTRYNKAAVALIRDWLSYFHFNRDMPLIIDEWNFDSGLNTAPERAEKAYISASYIPSRLKNMYDAGINYQLYFSLEDFSNEKENVIRNVGIRKETPKASYNIFRMLASLGRNMYFSSRIEDEFAGIIASKGKDFYALIVYNYIDPGIALNYLSRNISRVGEAERRFVINLIKKGQLQKILRNELDISTLRTTKRLKNLIKKAYDLNVASGKFKKNSRNIKINLKGLKNHYVYQKFVVDDSCSADCKFLPVEEKEVFASGPYEEVISLKPYSVALIVLKVKPVAPEPAVAITTSEKTQPQISPAPPAETKTETKQKEN